VAGAGLLSAMGLPTWVTRAQSGPADLATSPRKVLVLGAGMAGLTAALALLRRGHDVTVIEYQNR
jgi:NADPH-dependent 2,4-dienoyl-CoA reductase/sulfur reductase-like enzyme